MDKDKDSRSADSRPTPCASPNPSPGPSPRSSFKKRKLGTGSFKKLRRKSEELFRRRSKTPPTSLEAGNSGSPVVRHLSHTHPPASSSFSASSEDDSPLCKRKWSSSSHPGYYSSLPESPGLTRTTTFCSNLRTLTEDEYRYRQVLQCVVNPLGAPDTRPGFRPLELSEHLRKVFDVEEAQHNRYVKEVQNSKPSNIVLSVTVLEARDIKPVGQNGLSDPYCVLGVVKSKTPKGSPRGSPKSSPTLLRRRRSSYEQGDLKKTQTIKATLQPRWNESFELDVKDFQCEDLQVHVWDNGVRASPETDRYGEKPAGLKGFLKQFRSSVDFGKIDSFIGQFRVPLRDIPATGTDKWYDLYEDRKQRTRAMGQVRLKLELSIKQDADQLDSAESDQCSIEDYHHIVLRTYRHALQTAQQNVHKHSQDSKTPCRPLLHELPRQSVSILNQFAVQNHFSKIRQYLMDLIVRLEISGEEMCQCTVSEKLVKDAIVNLEMEWLRQTSSLKQDERLCDRILVTQTELTMFDQAASDFITNMIKGLREQHCIPKLFPPVELRLDDLNRKVSVAVSLLNLHLWTANDRVRKDASSLLIERLQDDIRKWVKQKLGTVYSATKDPVIPETKIMIDVLQEATMCVTPIYPVAQYFSRMGIDYFKVASMTIERALSDKAQELMHHMDQYQLRYHKYHANIQESSTASLQLYFALRSLYNMIRANVSDRDLFRITLANYQTWFEQAVMFWLQTFREECIRRMEKALEIEKDVVQVTSLVKHSNSSVDVLSCFAKITSEWRQIDICDADISVLGVTKITDTICDGAQQYVEKVEKILESNCYYDFIDNQQFDVTDQLCISLNNIAHVRQYLHELPHLLNWEATCQQLACKHEDESIGNKSLATLWNLIASADEDILVRGTVLLQRITHKMKVDLERYTAKFTRCHPEKRSSVDPLLAYLENNLQVFYQRMESHIFPLILEQLWVAELQVFGDTLMHGQKPEYYKRMCSHLNSLRDYFHRGGVTVETTDCALYTGIVDTLEMNMMSAEELMLEYYKTLVPSESCKSPSNDYYGQLTVKMGFQKETGGNVTVYIKVVQAKDLPGMNWKNLSDAFVSVLLCPTTMFPVNKPQKTQVIGKSVNPVFRETFEFQGIPQEQLSREGAVCMLSVWNYDPILPHDFLGELVLPLNELREIKAQQSIDDLPAAMWRLSRPVEPQDGPFMVLKERSELDKQSRALVVQRRACLGLNMQMCAPMRHLLSRARGKKTEVVGAPLLQGSSE